MSPLQLVSAASINPQAAADALWTQILAIAPQVAAASGPAYENWALPARQAIVPGANIAWDDEQVTLNQMGIGVGFPDNDKREYLQPSQITFYYDFEWSIVRGVSGLTGRGPGGGIPRPVALMNDAVVLQQDSAIMVSTMATILASELITPVGVPMILGDCQSIGPDGKIAGNHMPISFQAGVTPQFGY